MSKDRDRQVLRLLSWLSRLIVGLFALPARVLFAAPAHGSRNTDTSPNAIDAAKRIETYCALSKQHAEEYRSRRALEWRLHLAIWTILSATVALCLSNEVKLGGMAFCLFFAVPIHLIWTVMIVRGEIIEQNLSFYFREKALELIHDDRDERHRAMLGETTSVGLRRRGAQMPNRLRESFGHYYWWVFVQVGTTLLLSSVSFVLIR